MGFTATAQYENGTTVDVTTRVSWRSSDPAVAQVAGTGIATGLTPGTVNISAAMPVGETVVSDTARLQVNAPEIGIESLVVDPPASTVLVGGKQAFTARAILSDGSSQDVTGSVSWTSGDNAVAAVDKRGRATGLAAGSADIAATLSRDGERFTGNGQLTVQPAAVVVEEVVVDPPTATVLVGGSQQFRARTHLSDGSSHDVTDEVSWTVSAPAVAHVDSAGLATGDADGRSEITATLLFEGTAFRGSGRLTVQPPAVTIVEVRVLPPAARVFVGGKQQFTAEALLSDGSTVDITRDASWQTEDRAIASVDAIGRATGLASGATGITATVNYQGNLSSGGALLTVDPPVVVPQSLLVEPTQATVLAGSSQAFSAHLLLSDGSQQDVSGQATWSSSNGGIAGVDSSGLARGLAAGAADISARLNIGGTLFNDSGRLRVEDPAPTVTGLRVEPPTIEILVAARQQFLAFAQLSNGSEIDVSRDVSWRSSDGSIASVDAASSPFCRRR